ncbi:hypothetical protein HS048_14575 [Planomonospora sp. ID91781]|uniref:Uncharacterized protein n=3 Tax=Planomonospora TaxID=1998 RepID=A0A171BCE2_9ACTN|nr:MULTISPECIES: hypothetical protein [Planomonospora]MBG0821963.1 hypothetical protein [Planomonospora sp. ID91781]GAT64909.1 hypothetical protein PS9374_00541 [Planomonospora sphaerica]GGK47009.1 hypothetical protein GCM10010126_03470 [Planomonospora parontospora]GII06548.1 hypothetical protein Ppa06_03460 [Planomonospora parontospora subsp. parontospora]
MSKTLSRIALTGAAAATLVLSAASAALAGGYQTGGCGYGGFGFGGYGGNSYYNANQSAAGPQGAASTNLCTGTGGGLYGGLW